MTTSAPEPQPEGKAGAASANAGIQPSSGDGMCSGRPEPPLPSVPDHELLRCIGRGAYGAVWLARNVMGTFRAVKIVHREDFTRDRPFTREYEGLLHYEPISRSHPNLMQILHVGRHESYFYYVTELADDAVQPAGGVEQAGAGGQTREEAAFVASYVPRTLQEDLERRGRLPVRECVALATALASALKHLHNHGLVHRDVKPSNVILVHGVPKLADIGLVATVGDSHSIVGTEGYLPPEGPGNPQADLYSLGKLLYEVSTGLNRGEYPRLPRTLGALPDAPELLEFNEVLLKACAKDTTRRYHHAEDLLADLALLERGDSVKRLRRLERHHALLKRAGAGALVVGLIVSAGWWQSWRAHRIASRHLAQLHVKEGTERMIRGDFAASLPWLVGALELERGDPIRERVHRVRIANVLRRCPLPVAYFSVTNSKITAADLSPDGAILATVDQDCWLRLWDTRTGRQMRQMSDRYPASTCRFLPSGNRLLTLNSGQQVHLWDWMNANATPLTFTQAQGVGGDLYGVGLNEEMRRAYFAKGRYVFCRVHPFTGAFENLTLALKLIGRGKELLVKYEIRRATGDRKVLHSGEFLDTPKADPVADGRDKAAAPIWGRVFLALENYSWGDPGGDSGRTIWDNLRVRRYPSGEEPPPWRVVDDFSIDSSTNWTLYALPGEGRLCRVEHGQLVVSCARLPTAQTVSGIVMHREPLEISPAHTLEVEIDLILAEAPHRMANLILGRFQFNPASALDHRLVAHGRWLATTWWDGPIRIWDLQKPLSGGGQDQRSIPCLELGGRGIEQDMDFSPDTNHVAVVQRPNPFVEGTSLLRVWNFRNGSETTVNNAQREGATGARFSPDSRFLAVNRKDGLELLRTTDWGSATNLAAGSSFKFPRFSPRGCWLAAVRDERDIVVWDVGDQAAPWTTLSHQSDIKRITFSPDGRYLASICANDTVQVWDIFRAEGFGPPLPGAMAQFNPDGAQLMTITSSGGVWLWDLSRMTDDSLVVPPLLSEQTFVSSSDETMAAEIEAWGIALKLPASHQALPQTVPLRRLAFTAGDQYLVAEGSDQRALIWDIPTLTLAGPPKALRYDALLKTHARPEFPVEKRGQRVLSALAALLGQQRPDGQGWMRVVDEAERAQILDELQQAHPAEFALNETRRLNWHRAQAEAAEADMDWEAAVFHWERVGDGASKIPAQSGTKAAIRVESRLAYARQAAEVVRQAALAGRSRWSVVFPRPPWATAEMLDLAAFSSALPLGRPLPADPSGASFRGLASGVQILGGIGFDVRCIIHLKLTNHVSIPVGRACKRIHFLHAASQFLSNREKVAEYEAVYANGRNVAVSLLSPETVRPYAAHYSYQVSPLKRTNALPNLSSDLAWCGYASSPATRKQVLYLNRTTWTLPADHAGEVVQSIELRAGPAESAPLVFAITVE